MEAVGKKEYRYIRERGPNGAQLNKIDAPYDSVGWAIAREFGPGGKLYVRVPLQESASPNPGTEAGYLALGKDGDGRSQHLIISPRTLKDAWLLARHRFGADAWLGVLVPEPLPKKFRIRKR
jgi:hypothetical protein